jgi:hypothetical protein
METKRIKNSEIPALRDTLTLEQKGICPLCEKALGVTKRPALDHDHKTGYIRDVLCVNCNSMEGKIANAATRGGGKGAANSFLNNLCDYWNRHKTPRHGGILHPTHKTPEEKKVLANARARKKRADKAKIQRSNK